MKISVQGHLLYAYTGGKPFNPAQPTAVFIHGVLNDHSVWILQTRYFAHHGWNVLAVDLPGHCKSEGPPPQSAEEAADTVIALLDALKIDKAALIGHSFGSLIALEAAARDAVAHPGRVSHLVLVGTAYPMRVSPALLDLSVSAPFKAIDMVNSFSHSTLAPPPSALGPGTWLYGGSKALMRRVLASNPQSNVFYTGFKACDSYKGGEAAMPKVACPILFVLGSADQMTPPKAAQSLIDLCGKPTVVKLPAGHSLMTEAPEGVLQSLKDFLKP
jgi:pimeloyl-ACP methyl ester carboxylesterase